ncbi:MAG: Eco57I restriction-modification methylase domain-containing protein [Planctomycetota bacterium]|nr:Eco57I restriction-modification methylase domain-containing protein [Planctomycetota bacterium]
MPDSRKTGRYYTPPDLARQMARETLDAWFVASGQRDAAELPRVLDPACGNGAFLVEVCDLMAAHITAEKRQRTDETVPESRSTATRIAQSHLYGVDIDEGAIRELRQALRDRIGENGDLQFLNSNIVVGDALCGDDFQSSGTSSVDGTGSGGGASMKPTVPCDPTDDSENSTAIPTTVDWRRQFPEVARDGGFDIIIGNPPYIRERDAKPLFDRIAQSKLGKAWRTARMDLWYYFVHRALDLLKPGGLLTFVVPSYWIDSQGASRLIERFRQETKFEDVMLLGNWPVFAGVQGRHLVFRVRSAPLETGLFRTPISDLTTADRVTIRTLGSDRDLNSAWSAAAIRTTSHAALFSRGRLLLQPAELPVVAQSRLLGDFFEVRQGIAENPPRISRRLAQRFGGRFAPGEGVFVLNADEIDRLKLTEAERGLLRPYFAPVEISRYRLNGPAQTWLLYLTKQTAPTIEVFPNVAAHLTRFREILRERREVQMGRIDWWHLHWPRQERLFLEPRLLGIQMGRSPRFAYVEQPAFTGFSTHVIAAREAGAPTLPALAVILNSRFAAQWFDANAKRRGVHIDISGDVLRRFPLPARDIEREARLDAMVRDYCATQTQSVSAIEPPDWDESPTNSPVGQDTAAREGTGSSVSNS